MTRNIVTYCGLETPPDLSRPSAKAVRDLVARLRDADPAVRIRTIRSLRKTTDGTILKALVHCLADPFFYWSRGAGDPGQIHLVIDEAADAILWQGKPVIDALIAFGKGKENKLRPFEVVLLLGKLGPDPRTLAFLKESLVSPQWDYRWSATKALGTMGHEGVPMLLTVARDDMANGILRCDTLEALAKTGADPSEFSQFLISMLKHPDWSIASAAADASAALKVRAALPELTRLAKDEKVNQNARCSAVHAVRQLAPGKDAEKLLLELLEKNCHAGVRGKAMAILAELDCRAAIPKVLAALDDSDWYVRALADHSLRAFFDQPAGAGYDPVKPDGSRWREWVKARK